MKNLLQTGFDRRILQKMTNRPSYYNKETSRSRHSSFKEQTLGGKV